MIFYFTWVNNHFFVQIVGYEGNPQTLQVFPLAILINPLSPHPFPQEFLIFHESPEDPTRRTPWLIAVPQLLKIPPLYRDQTLASTATETGRLATAF